jgi:hypothetical protein
MDLIASTTQHADLVQDAQKLAHAISRSSGQSTDQDCRRPVHNRTGTPVRSLPTPGRVATALWTSQCAYVLDSSSGETSPVTTALVAESGGGPLYQKPLCRSTPAGGVRRWPGGAVRGHQPADRPR